MAANQRHKKKKPAASSAAPAYAPRSAPTEGEPVEVEDAARKGLIILAVAIVVVVIAMGVALQRKSAAEKVAMARAAEYATLDEAFAEEPPMMALFMGMQPEKLDERIAALQATIEAHPGSTAAAEAEYYIAFTTYEKKEYADAATKFAAFIDTHGADLPAMAAWARLGQANALSAQGKNDEAYRLYQSLATVDLNSTGTAAVAPFAQLFGATCALDLGKTAEAKTMLESLLASDAPTQLTDDAQLILSRIALVGDKITAAPAADATPDAAPSDDEDM